MLSTLQYLFTGVYRCAKLSTFGSSASLIVRRHYICNSSFKDTSYWISKQPCFILDDCFFSILTARVQSTTGGYIFAGWMGEGDTPSPWSLASGLRSFLGEGVPQCLVLNLFWGRGGCPSVWSQVFFAGGRGAPVSGSRSFPGKGRWATLFRTGDDR